MYSQKTVTYDTTKMKRKVVVQYNFKDGTALVLLRLEDKGMVEWQVIQTNPSQPRTVLGHYASVSVALQTYNKAVLRNSWEKGVDAHETWFLPSLDEWLEEAFLTIGGLRGNQ